MGTTKIEKGLLIYTRDSRKGLLEEKGNYDKRGRTVTVEGGLDCGRGILTTEGDYYMRDYYHTERLIRIGSGL